MPSEDFKDRILNELLPDFCNDPARNYDMAGFKANFHTVHDADADAFLKALDAGLVERAGNMYRAPRSCAREQLFWEGPKATVSRSITIWAEPIITIATLSRLHFELGWPKELLGTQSKDWAFDVIAFLPADLVNEHVACEVKKTDREVISLVQWMREFSVAQPREPANNKERNAYRKLSGLRARRAPLFWAVGPGGTGAAFKVSYADDGSIDFKDAALTELRYPG